MNAPSTRGLVICTLRYSDNLGDGVIGDCLEYMIGRVEPGRTVYHLDMAGRQGFAPPGDGSTNGFKSVFYKTPDQLRFLLTLAAWPLIIRPKITAAWNAVVPKKDFDLVFGGGHMLTDIALNFPLKLSLVAKLAREAGARVALNAVGATSRWSGLATTLFRKSLADPSVVYASVRDEDSFNSIRNNLPSVASKFEVTVDPGVWAADAYGVARNPQPDLSRLTIGVGISHPAELASYADDKGSFTQSSLLDYWLDLIGLLRSQGHDVTLFTNGSAEDEHFLRHIVGEMKRTRPDVTFSVAPRAATPADLVRTIAGFDGLIGHRLHANIVAFSLGIPTVCLVWDKKVLAFAELSGRRKWCVDRSVSAADTVALMMDAMSVGVDEAHRNHLKSIAMSNVEKILHRLRRTS